MASHFIKYGLDFVEAQKHWDDPDLIEVKAAFEKEPGFFSMSYCGRIEKWKRSKLKQNRSE